MHLFLTIYHDCSIYGQSPDCHLRVANIIDVIYLTFRLPPLRSSKRSIFPPVWAGKVASASAILLPLVTSLVSVLKTHLSGCALRISQPLSPLASTLRLRKFCAPIFCFSTIPS